MGKWPARSQEGCLAISERSSHFFSRAYNMKNLANNKSPVLFAPLDTFIGYETFLPASSRRRLFLFAEEFVCCTRGSEDRRERTPFEFLPNPRLNTRVRGQFDARTATTTCFTRRIDTCVCSELRRYWFGTNTPWIPFSCMAESFITRSR